MAFILPELPFAKDALAPHMSAETFDYHHGKHHKAYVDKTNGMLGEKGLEGASLIEVIKAAKDKGDKGLFNNSAQIWNHSFFWQCLAPTGATAPVGQAEGDDRQRFRRPRRAARKARHRKRQPFRQRLGLAGPQQRQARSDVAPRRRHAGRARHDAAADARCVGTCLLHRLSQRAAALPQDRAREHHQLGLRRPEPRRAGRLARRPARLATGASQLARSRSNG